MYGVGYDTGICCHMSGSSEEPPRQNNRESCSLQRSTRFYRSCLSSMVRNVDKKRERRFDLGWKNGSNQAPGERKYENFVRWIVVPDGRKSEMRKNCLSTKQVHCYVFVEAASDFGAPGHYVEFIETRQVLLFQEFYLTVVLPLVLSLAHDIFTWYCSVLWKVNHRTARG